jgi:DNA-binding Xre family transcriptional regulator
LIVAQSPRTTWNERIEHGKNSRIQAQRKIVEAAREAAERERPEVIAEGKRVFAAMDIASVHLRNSFSLLQALRKNQGTTLTALADATGINKSTLSKLENDPESNVTLSTLVRVSEALGYDLQISVTPRPRTPAKRAKAERPVHA